MSTVERPRTLRRLCEIASEIARTQPSGDDIVRELFALAADIVRDEKKPQPIETAPKLPNSPLLLYCPNQGGWHIGEWIALRWTDPASWQFLSPTHWIEMPDAPEGSSGELGREAARGQRACGTIQGPVQDMA
jgi:hypothetical protein